EITHAPTPHSRRRASTKRHPLQRVRHRKDAWNRPSKCDRPPSLTLSTPPLSDADYHTLGRKFGPGISMFSARLEEKGCCGQEERADGRRKEGAIVANNARESQKSAGTRDPGGGERAENAHFR